MPCVMSHISCVQTPVNASGKNSSKVFFLPKLPPSFTSTTPEACLDLRLKSGALVPTVSAIGLFSILNFGFQTFFRIRKVYRAGSARCQITIRLLAATPATQRSIGPLHIEVSNITANYPCPTRNSKESGCRKGKTISVTKNPTLAAIKTDFLVRLRVCIERQGNPSTLEGR